MLIGVHILISGNEQVSTCKVSSFWVHKASFSAWDEKPSLIVCQQGYSWLWQYLWAWAFILFALNLESCLPAWDWLVFIVYPALVELSKNGSGAWRLVEPQVKSHVFLLSLLRFSCFSWINFFQYAIYVWSISRVLKYLVLINLSSFITAFYWAPYFAILQVK